MDYEETEHADVSDQQREFIVSELEQFLKNHFGAETVTIQAARTSAERFNEVPKAPRAHPDYSWYIACDLKMPDEQDAEPVTVQVGETNGQFAVHCVWEGYAPEENKNPSI